jgi:predicted nucleotidyltransferase
VYELSREERERIAQQLAERLSRYSEIVGAWVHGSFDEGLPFHDIDIALYVEPESDAAHDPLAFMLRLMDELEPIVRYPVDVRVINRAPLNFQFYATAGRPLLMRDPERCYQFIEHVRRMYWDFQPMAYQHLREVLG